jgi:hypothetical protein
MGLAFAWPPLPLSCVKPAWWLKLIGARRVPFVLPSCVKEYSTAVLFDLVTRLTPFSL